MSRASQHFKPARGHSPPPSQPASSPLDFTDKIPISELRLSNETLGSGSFGTVFKGYWRNRMVAVKQFRTREEIDSFLVEVKQLSCVKHPNIVTLYGASTLTDTAYLVMEYAEGGSLNHLLHECKQQRYDLRHACSWAKQTAQGVAYLHEIRPKPIMHRDLKPANLLLFSRGKILKICDFGTACTVRTQMTNNTGSASYMAPEVFATSNYLESGDVFSWSIIFWEILARRHPYSQQCSNPYQILWRVKQDGIRPNELENCPKIIWRLITRSWDKDPLKRPSMRQVANEMELVCSLADRSILALSSSSDSSGSSQSNTDNVNHFNQHHHHHHQQQQHHQNIQQQQRRLSSIHNNSQLFPLGSYQIQHPQLPFLPPTIEPRSQRSSDNRSPISINKRGIYYHHQALLHRLERTKELAEKLSLELRESTGCDTNIEPYKLIDEIKRLQDENRKKTEELNRRRVNSSSPVRES